MIIAIVAHVRVVTALQAQENGRARNVAGDVEIGRLHPIAFAVNHFDKKLMKCLGIFRQEFTHTNSFRIAMRFDFIGRKHIALHIATFSTQRTWFERYVPIDDGGGVVLRFERTHFASIQQKASLRCIGIANHSHGEILIGIRGRSLLT